MILGNKLFYSLFTNTYTDVITIYFFANCSFHVCFSEMNNLIMNACTLTYRAEFAIIRSIKGCRYGHYAEWDLKNKHFQYTLLYSYSIDSEYYWLPWNGVQQLFQSIRLLIKVIHNNTEEYIYCLIYTRVVLLMNKIGLASTA